MVSTPKLPKLQDKVTSRDRQALSWSLTETLHDLEWDAYLEQNPCGQFQQSSRWARVKASEGWNVLRGILRRGDSLAGGAQILYRQSRLGCVGYVAKGPVVSDDADTDHILGLVLDAGRHHGLKGLIVQAPDRWGGDPAIFDRRDGQPERLMGIIDATLAIDLARPMPRILADMNPEARRRISQAKRRGIRIREGSKDDVELFFGLMLESCRRQNVSPNPHSVRGLRDLWDAFANHGGIRITFAQAGEEVIAGLLSIVFGNRVTIWRKGWRNVDPRLNPNRLLYLEAMEWGHAQGLKWCDFGSLNRASAEALLGGQALPAEGMTGRDAFHLSFGGQPFLLPTPYFFAPNAAMRLVYGLGVRSGVAGWLKATWTKRRKGRVA